MEVARLVVIVVLLLAAGFGTIVQTVVSRLPRIRAHGLAQDENGAGDALVAIVEDPAPYMTAAVVLSLGCYIVAAVLATTLGMRHLGSEAEVAIAVALAIVIIGVFELGLRSFAVVNLEAVALRLARPARALGVILKPLSQGLLLISAAVMAVLPGPSLRKGPFVTPEEVRANADEEEEDEEDEEEERELISSIFEFGDTVVREVMVPRPDMICVAADMSLDEALEVALRAGFSRIPIFQSDTDNILGVLYVKDVLKRLREGRAEETKVRALGRAPLFVPETKKVADLLREMQQERVHMAIVVDEYGGTAGLVTIEDLIEEIVGEIVDEYDQEEPLVEPIDDDTIRVDAKMPIDEVNEILDVELPHEEWDTVGGLVFGLTGHVPIPGEKVGYDHVEFVAEKVSGRRVQKVIIRRLEQEDSAEAR